MNRQIICFLLCIACLLNLTTSCMCQAQQDIATLEKSLNNSRNDSERMKAYEQLVNFYRFSATDTTAMYLERGLKEFTIRKYTKGMALMALMHGELYAANGAMDEADQKFRYALAQYAEIHDRAGLASVNNSYGVMEGRRGNNDKAVKYFMVALKEFEALNDTLGLMNSYIKLGIINERINDLDKALIYLNKALSYQEGDLLDRKAVVIYNNLGIVYGKKRQPEKAIAYLEKAFAGANKYGQTGLKISSLTNLGMVYVEIGRNADALRCFDTALMLTKDKGQPENYARLLMNRASVFTTTAPLKGIQTLKEAMVIAKQLNAKLLLLDIYDDMVDMYAAVEDYKQALEMLQTEQLLADSVFNIDKAKEIADLQNVYELEGAKEKVALLEHQGRKNKRTRSIMITVATALGIMTVLVLVVYRRTRRLNRMLARREYDLQKTDKIKDKIFSIIGHDLRGPIGAVPVMLQLLKGHEESAQERRHLIGKMIDHAEISMATLDKLLYWGQSQIKGAGIKPERFNPKDYVTHNLLLIKPNADEKEITVTDHTGADIMVIADTTHFDFVLRNLLSNAVKFTYQGGAVSITADSNTRPGYVIFAVKDNGIGIRQEHSSNIFEPFGSNAMGTANEKGNSIGLMLCRDFVRDNGGDIWLESEYGKGSVFYFSLKNGDQ